MLAISTQANEDIQLNDIQRVMHAIQNISSNGAALNRKARKHNLKCVSPCQVITMTINSKVGFQTETSQTAINRALSIDMFWKYFAKTAQEYQSYSLKWRVCQWKN